MTGISWVVLAHAVSPRMRGRGRQTSKFEAKLVYRACSRTARDTVKPCLEKQTNKQKQQNLNILVERKPGRSDSYGINRNVEMG